MIGWVACATARPRREHHHPAAPTPCTAPEADAPSPDTQSLALATVVSILNSTKSTDIPGLVAALDPVEQVRHRFPARSTRPRADGLG